MAAPPGRVKGTRMDAPHLPDANDPTRIIEPVEPVGIPEPVDEPEHGTPGDPHLPPMDPAGPLPVPAPPGGVGRLRGEGSYDRAEAGAAPA